MYRAWIQFLVLTWCNFLQTDRMESEFFVLMVSMLFVGGRTFGDQCIKANLQFWFHQIPFDLGDDVWWPLVMYGETVVHHLLFFVGEWLIWFTFIFFTKHWCPFAAFDNFEIHSWMGAWVGPGWVRPWAWGCPAGVLATGPWCYLSKKHKIWVSLENSNI